MNWSEFVLGCLVTLLAIGVLSVMVRLAREVYLWGAAVFFGIES